MRRAVVQGGSGWQKTGFVPENPALTLFGRARHHFVATIACIAFTAHLGAHLHRRMPYVVLGA